MESKNSVAETGHRNFPSKYHVGGSSGHKAGQRGCTNGWMGEPSAGTDASARVSKAALSFKKHVAISAQDAASAIRAMSRKECSANAHIRAIDDQSSSSNHKVESARPHRTEDHRKRHATSSGQRPTWRRRWSVGQRRCDGKCVTDGILHGHTLALRRYDCRDHREASISFNGWDHQVKPRTIDGGGIWRISYTRRSRRNKRMDSEGGTPKLRRGLGVGW